MLSTQPAPATQPSMPQMPFPPEGFFGRKERRGQGPKFQCVSLLEALKRAVLVLFPIHFLSAQPGPRAARPTLLPHILVYQHELRGLCQAGEPHCCLCCVWKPVCRCRGARCWAADFSRRHGKGQISLGCSQPRPLSAAQPLLIAVFARVPARTPCVGLCNVRRCACKSPPCVPRVPPPGLTVGHVPLHLAYISSCSLYLLS